MEDLEYDFIYFEHKKDVNKLIAFGKQPPSGTDLQFAATIYGKYLHNIWKKDSDDRSL